MDKYKTDSRSDTAIMDNEGNIIAVCLDMLKASEYNMSGPAKHIVSRENARKNAIKITKILNAIDNLRDSLVSILINVEAIDIYSTSRSVSNGEKKMALDKLRKLLKDLSDET